MFNGFMKSLGWGYASNLIRYRIKLQAGGRIDARVTEATPQKCSASHACVTEGPQVVTRRGTETAVLVPIAQRKRLNDAARPSFKALLLSDAGRADLALPQRGWAKRRLTAAWIRPQGAVVSWLDSVADDALYLCAMTLGEIQAGIEITRKQGPGKAWAIEAWADQVGATYNVLPMDAATFRLWAKLMYRQSNTVYEDAMIAASALVHKLTVVTRNVRDSERFHVPVFNPFGA
ncbi:hypothetical protein DFQ28_006209 [Apophysomyces sp. BC1034]|nr:hypothetical protein DFQ30_008190 [Apophysomyces sp. BC1015]KAG0193200.1 hypothetical protein DFQ28_006209 [Apophysomyces sp. BC1034]